MTNKIYYIDFEPQVLDKSFWKGNNYEALPLVMDRVNEWVRKNYNYEIINVETLLIPKSSYEKNTGDVKKVNMASGQVYLLQVVRVWCK